MSEAATTMLDVAGAVPLTIKLGWLGCLLWALAQASWYRRARRAATMPPVLMPVGPIRAAAPRSSSAVGRRPTRVSTYEPAPRAAVPAAPGPPSIAAPLAAAGTADVAGTATYAPPPGLAGSTAPAASPGVGPLAAEFDITTGHVPGAGDRPQ